MARQNMGTPKFYIDMLSYWKAQGNLMQSLMAHQVEIPVKPSSVISSSITLDDLFLPRGEFASPIFLGMSTSYI